MDVFGQENERVGDVTLHALLSEKIDFLIPPYQRGYRWRGREVKALIDDLHSFFTSSKYQKGERYCLQPLVVQPRVDGGYIVVDGQQRLTTLAILLLSSCIPADTERENILNILADRSARPASDEGAPSDESAQHVWTIKPRDGGCNDGKLSAECRKIALRIAKRHQDEIWEIREHLNDIVFVFYKLTPYRFKDDDAVARETFRRINAGKVSLSSSELLRALFFEPDAIGVDEQHEIAAEWEQIQTRLKDDSFWHMFNKDDIPVYRRMDRFFAIVAKCEGEGKNVAPRLAFDKIEADITQAGAHKADKIKAWWTAAMDLFWMLQYCYADLRVYHYIGWLRRCSLDSFAELYNLYNAKHGDFADVLRRRIASKIGDRLNLAKKSDPEDDNKTFETFGYCYDDSKEDLRAFLLLVNLEMMNRMYAPTSKNDRNDFDSDVGYGQCRFPFLLYDATSWDIEHVASHTANPMENPVERQQWAEGVRDETDVEDFKCRLDAWLKKEEEQQETGDVHSASGGEDEFVALYNEWVERIGRGALPTEMQKNRIGNLVLLDFETNRGYGNSIFPIKRRIIHEVETGMKMDASGHATATSHRFIMPQTSNVFKKSVSARSPKTLQAWTVDDINNNEIEISHIVEEFKK